MAKNTSGVVLHRVIGRECCSPKGKPTNRLLGHESHQPAVAVLVIQRRDNRKECGENRGIKQEPNLPTALIESELGTDVLLSGTDLA